MAKQMNTKQQNRVHIHGTLGVGKSYLLAALVSLLWKEGVRVVYVLDCYELCMFEPPVSYLISSLATSFCKDVKLGPVIRTLADTLLEIRVLSKDAPGMDHYISAYTHTTWAELDGRS
ncbi:hypothetical protein BGX38DRAFT_1270908 [Terfezia claveryi]|nr:hypothetical protein BGX38DRAFT_1270908 [Terfezia claveryi]